MVTLSGKVVSAGKHGIVGGGANGAKHKVFWNEVESVVPEGKGRGKDVSRRVEAFSPCRRPAPSAVRAEAANKEGTDESIDTLDIEVDACGPHLGRGRVPLSVLAVLPGSGRGGGGAE